MARYLIRPAAREDLEQIWRYTEETWGEAQANRYVSELFERFELLADTPHLGRDADMIRPGYRQSAVRKHVIFYRLTEDEAADVVRVLHERMLPNLHL